MDGKEKIRKEITRLKELMKENDAILDQIPEYMRANEELTLKICKMGLAVLEQELIRLEGMKNAV